MSGPLFDPHQLSVGQVLPRDAYNDKGRLLLRRGTVISSASQLEIIAQSSLVNSTPDGTPPPVETTIPSSPLAMVLAARWRLLALFEQGSSYFPADLLRIAALVHRACRANADLSLASILLMRDAPYVARHAVNTAIVCEVVASALEWPDDMQSATVAAALTMNVGMLELQQQLYETEGRLNDGQRAAVRQHCELGVELLRGLGVDDPVWLAAVRDHHESPDGSGYPAGKRGDEIDLPAHLLNLADIYCARVSARSYRPAMSPTLALRQLFLKQGASMDEALVAQIIKTLGVYPPGTGVRLRNGSVAVVTHRGNTGNAPRVAAITSPAGMRLATPLRHNGDAPSHGIQAVVDLDELNLAVPLAALWGGDAVL